MNGLGRPWLLCALWVVSDKPLNFNQPTSRAVHSGTNSGN